MSGALLEKLWGALKFPRDEEPEPIDGDNNGENGYEEPDGIEEPDETEGRKIWNRKNSKVVNMPQVQQVKLVISQPTTFDQAANICDLLREKKAIIVNLEYVNKDVARRIIDVVYGAVIALDGHMEKVSNAIVLVAPFSYDVENDKAREEIKNKVTVSWVK